jgi:hypothetical protein
MSKADRTHCNNGHPFSGENLVVVQNPQGLMVRACRECRRAANKRLLERRRAGIVPRQYKHRQKPPRHEQLGIKKALREIGFAPALVKRWAANHREAINE